MIGYEIGAIKIARYWKTSGGIQLLNKGYTWESLSDEPSIILSILPIVEANDQQTEITLVVGWYTNYLYLLKLTIQSEIQNIEETKSSCDIELSKPKKAKKNQPKWEITKITNVMESGLKPGVWEIKYIKEHDWILVGSFDHRARLYRIKKRENPRLVGLLKQHKKIINCIDYRITENDIWEVLIGSEDGAITLWTLPF